MKRTNTAQWVEKAGRWQINVQKDGVRKTFTSAKPGRTGQKEANAKADRWLDDGIENTKIKVKQASIEYINHLKASTSQSNWRQCDTLFRVWINPCIGNVKVIDLTSKRLQDVIDRAYKNGKLAKKTLINLRACLMSFIKYCRMDKLTTLFPEGLTIPKGAKAAERTILQPTHLQMLFKNDTTIYYGKEIKDPFINAYRFQALTGLRPGELCGLKWSDIKNGSVYLRRSINTYGETTTGKNQNASRNFTLNIFTNKVLNAQKQYLDSKNISSAYVFPDEHGGALKSPRYRTRWEAYSRYHDMPQTTPYELRHTFVSAVKTLPEGYLKQLVGHSKDMDTYGTYAHQINNDAANAAELVQNIFRDILAG